MLKALENPESAVVELLKRLNVKFTTTHVKESLQGHPDYPSLLSVIDVLKHFKIDNLALQTDQINFDKVPVPFISGIQGLQAGFVVVTSADDDQVTYYFNGKRFSESKQVFFKKWNETVIVTEVSDLSGEAQFTVHRKKERQEKLNVPALILIGLAGIAMAVSNIASLFSAGAVAGFIAIAILKLAGVFVCTMLLWYEVDKSNPLLEKICKQSRGTNCNEVLGSKQSTLFGKISWSEIGFVYFGGSFLFTIVGAGSFNSMPILAYVNLLCVPYTFFSVYYQWRVVKSWCVLCLTVQALLLLEFVVNTSTGYFHLLSVASISFAGVGVALLCFMTPVVGWIFFKPFLLSSEMYKQQRKELSRLKYDRNIFETLLQHQKKISVAPLGLGIVIGNPNAGTTIIKVCNPYCGPCAKAHPDLEKIITENPDINARIIFTARQMLLTKVRNPLNIFLHLQARAIQG